MPLQSISEKPLFVTEEEHSRSQESTPSTFSNLPPILRLQLDNVKCHLLPSTAFPHSSGIDEGRQAGAINGNETASDAVHQGMLFLTDESISFLPLDQKGFSLDYPSLSLHAISRSLPQAMQDSSLAASEAGCVYCQLDLSAGTEEEQDEEGDDNLAELWIVPAEADQVEKLFETLSHCASLHPSIMEDGEDGGFGNPFSSIGPFGTGLAQNANGDERHAQLQNEGAFEDAEEEGGDAGPSINLSESGRATLAHLDSLLQMQDENEEHGYGTSPAASFHSSDPRHLYESKAAEATKATSVAPTEALILVNVPNEVFYTPSLASALLDLLHAYGEMDWWLTLPGFGRAIVMYSKIDGAKRAKEALDRILIPLIDEGEDEAILDLQEGSDVEPRKLSAGDGEGLVLRAYYGEPQALSRLRDQGEAHLPVPTTDRNFLISPPGSPPVGWEPIREDPPNTNTLADDLMRALGSLRDRGLGVRSHTPEPLEDGERSNTAVHSQSHRRTASSSSLAPPTASVIIPPRQAAVRSYHPLAKEAYDVSETKDEEANGLVSLPGVTVQNVDAEEDGQEEGENRMNKGLSISSVKATVESMRGAPASLNHSSSEKITPTARPPLG